MKKSFLPFFFVGLLGAMLGSLLMYGWILGTHPAQVNAQIASPQVIRVPVGDDDSIVKAAEKVGGSVVNINTMQLVPVQGFDDFFKNFFGDNSPFGESPFGSPYGNAQPRTEKRQGIGSGVIVDSNGYILTNEHVVGGASEITVTLTDKRKFQGKVVGSDRTYDIAIVKIDAKDLPAAALGNSSQVKIGEWVIAIGNPMGYSHTVTVGVLSGRGRQLADSTRQYEDLLQTDAAINPGNSGGPLVNTKGEVIGINTAIIPYAQGIGFAIPIDSAKTIMDELIKNGKIIRPYLGIYMDNLTEDPKLWNYLKLPKDLEGIIVTAVVAKSPAEEAGIQRYDVITEVDHQKIKEPEDLRKLVRSKKPGDKITLLLYREGQLTTVEAKVGKAPN